MILNKSTPKVNNRRALADHVSAATLPREKMHRDTWGMFLASNKSGVWKTSSSGTPYFLAADRKDWTFSISKNAGPCTNRRGDRVVLPEVASYLLLELLHTVRLDLVHQSTQDNTVLQNVGEVSLGELFVKNSFNPLIISI